MAGKARRAAARQGELSRRRKRNQRGPSGVPAVSDQNTGNGLAVAATTASAGAAAIEDGSTQPAQPAPSVAAVQAPAPSASPAPQPRAQGRTRGERPAAYNYVGAELRRIAVLSTVVIAALVALSIVL